MNRETDVKPGIFIKVGHGMWAGFPEAQMQCEPKPSPADMADAHWSYVNSVLVAHGVPDDHREVAKHHYIAAFIHGFKHGAAERA